MVNTLFGSEEGFEAFDLTVTRRVERLPGFDGLTSISDTLRQIISQPKIA
jgi:hypothetical protein